MTNQNKIYRYIFFALWCRFVGFVSRALIFLCLFIIQFFLFLFLLMYKKIISYIFYHFNDHNNNNDDDSGDGEDDGEEKRNIYIYFTPNIYARIIKLKCLLVYLFRSLFFFFFIFAFFLSVGFRRGLRLTESSFFVLVILVIFLCLYQ